MQKGYWFFPILVFIFLLAGYSQARGEDLLLDDFQGVISGGPQGTVDFGSGGGSTVEVSAATDIKRAKDQSLKVVYNAVAGGYMWIARGFGLDAKNARWLVKPEDVDWGKYKAISFYMYGSDSKVKIAFDIKDSGNEISRFLVEDNFKGWKKIICPFSDFFVRGDWQPDNADKNAKLDFPIKSFQFEPRPIAQGVVYFDCVELLS
ncbi:MAG: carbohydrate binding domain-containing protein [Candidatus Omnitrophota bacterium]